MPKLPRTYRVECTHASLSNLCGIFTFTVKDAYGNPGEVYVSALQFGCSRDYRAASDEEAIRLVLAEHATQALSINPA